MSVAVIIPNLNYGQWLGRAIASVQRQTVPVAGVIVVDGGSTDDSKSTAANLHAAWIETPALGMADARNVGIALTLCEFIVPLDADDWIEPTFVERCLDKMLEDDKVGVVATGLKWPDGREQWPREPFTREAFLTGNRLFTCSMLRRQCWLDVGGYDTDRRLFEDWLFWARIVEAGWKIATVPEALFHYCPHEGSSCGRMNSDDHAQYRTRTVQKIQEASCQKA